MTFSYYSEGEAYIATKIQSLESKMQIFWKDEEVKNLRTRNFTFANLGSKHIDQADLIDGRLVSIPVPTGCRALDATILAQSRPELSFKADIGRLKSSPAITIVLQNNEAIEEKDGLRLNLVYTGQDTCNFVPQARIKGHIEALNKLSTNIFAGVTWDFDFILKHVTTLLCVLGYIVIYRSEKRLRELSELSPKVKYPSKLPLRILLVFLLIVVSTESYVIIRNLTGRLPWL